MSTTLPPRDLMAANSLTSDFGQMLRRAPLYRVPNRDVGWAEVPIGMPPENDDVVNMVSDDASMLSLTGTTWTPASEPGSAAVGGILLSGLNESVLLHPTKLMMRVASAGARRRAIRRDNLKLWVIRGLFLSPSTIGLGGTQWLRQARGHRSARPKRRLIV